jgi:F-type H+-transporting ATPase subunit a
LEKTKKWTLGVNRWFVLLFAVLGIVGTSYFPAVQPHIQVAAERVMEEPLFTLPVIGPFYLTNTFFAMLIVDVIILAMAFIIRQSIRGGSLVPKGLANAFETLLEAIYNMTESTAGSKWAKTIFPWFATIMIVVLVANWVELIPGIDTIGKIEESQHGYPTITLIPGVLGAVVKGEPQEGGGSVILPYVRALSTDLNFTASLAIISVFMTQVIGIQAARSRYRKAVAKKTWNPFRKWVGLQFSGMGYFTKFFNTTTLFSKPGFGLIDLLVGILEFISELSKILSFSFRLFGNIFAGMVLLFLVGALMPPAASWLQSGVLLFEFFIGLIQAFVFGMLTMVFMSQATVSHGGGEHGDELTE